MRPPRRSVRLAVEALERRLAPAVFNIPAGDTAALAAAITTANVNNQADTIELAANSTYTFSAVADPADGGSALPSILRDTNSDANTVTIHGNGATLQRDAAVGTPQFRFIRTGVFPDNVRLAITDLTFANGDAGLAKGGAILLQAGDLSLTRCTFTNNRADTGGAVYVTTTTIPNRFLSVVDSTFTGNTATGLAPGGGGGGAVYTFGSSDVTLLRDTFTLNTAFREGGGLRVLTSSGVVTIADSLIANNTADGGAGVFLQAPATITNTVVRDNLSVGSGGGIWIQGGTLNLSGSVVSGNRVTSTTASGGGISSQATTTITDVTVRDNTAGSSGGGISIQGSLTLTRSTVSGNRAESAVGSGGGVDCQGPLTIVNSTIHNNRAGSGGGVAFYGGPSDVGSITQSTITDNRAFWTLASGGGIDIGYGNLSLGGTIVAGNALEPTATGGTGPDLKGTFNSFGYNLIQNMNGATFTGTTTGNVIGVAPNLGPLQDNGGPTFTRLPVPTSPARDAGDPAFVPPPATDQRGRPRVQNGRIDIGAVELAAAPTVANIQVNGGAAQRSMVRSITVTFSDRVTFAGGDANAAAAFTLSRIGGGGNVGLAAAVSVNGLGQTVVTLTFTNANPAVIDQISTQNGGPLSLANGRYQLAIADGAVTGEGGPLDGDGNGTAGGAFVTPPDTAGSGAGYHYGLYRCAGDITGNGVVDLADLASFRSTFNLTAAQPGFNSGFDFDNNGVIDLADLAQFRTCFNQVVFP